MKNYETPEAVEIGFASEAILGTKEDPLGDDVQGPDFPHILASAIDVD
jgi:hypothetical protein